MALTQYTTPDEVRGILGVAAKELPDAVLESALQEQLLIIDLEQINVSLPASYLALTGALSANQTRFQSLVQAFSAYSVAREKLSGLPLSSPVRIQDGRAELERTADPYKGVREGVEAMYAFLRARLAAAYLVLFPTATVPSVSYVTIVTSTGLALDPVTNA